MDTFGLDIGSQKIKLAQIGKKGGQPCLLAFGAVATPARSFLSEAEGDLNLLGEKVKKLHDEAEINNKNAVVALPEDMVFTKMVTFPALSEKELASAINWEAEQYIPVPLNEVILDYKVIRKRKEDKVEKIDILLIAAPKRLVEKLVKVLKKAGLKPASLETEILSLTRSLVAGDKPVLLVDFGFRATDLALVENQQVVFTRSLSTAGLAFSRAVAASLDLDLKQAEEYKKTYGLEKEKLEGKIKDSLQPVLETVSSEMEKAIRFYQTSQKGIIKRMILAGGNAVLPDLVNLLAEKLNIEVQVGNPLLKLEKDSEISKRLPPALAPVYAVAIGLALKEISSLE